MVAIRIKNPCLCNCGEESTRGCHGLKDGELYDEYFCDNCYNKTNQTKKVRIEDEQSESGF